MTKLKTPLLSLNARGGLGKVLAFVRRRRQNIAEKKPIPTDAKSLAQLSWRHMYQKCTILWHALSAAEKLAWESNARSRHMTGYAWFISQCLRPNPGIYLPLQGGTMAGDIDMAKHKIEKLPAPTDNQEADTLGARNTAIGVHAAQPIIHQDAPGLIAIHAAIANVHHTPPPNTFLGETDTPGNYVGDALKLVRVNAGQTALEFVTPTVGAQLIVAETEVFNGAEPNVWTDLDLSGVVGSQATLVIIKAVTGASFRRTAFRKNGDTDDFYYTGAPDFGCGAACADARSDIHSVYIVCTDNSGIIEWKSEATVNPCILDIIAYIK